jgi:2-polyprenyl-3-methyl-5-hydroxy-6-metoxy-1,4-benzoquinol methylase
MSEATAAAPPNPVAIFDALNAYIVSRALQGAIKLNLFTLIGEGATTPAAIAPRALANERGVRILCDFLTIHGFLTKKGSEYGLPPVSAAFLNRNSPAYMGSIADFLLTDSHFDNFKDVAGVVRKGGTLNAEGNVSPENPVWVEFAKSMVPIVAGTAEGIAKLLAQPGRAIKVLDIAAGHGMFGITIARHNPQAQIVAQDWKSVLEVAQENAAKSGVAARFRTIPGSAFDVDFGSGYDLVLLPNFLHHFDAPTNINLLKKIHAAMNPGGRVATAEFVPNEDRVTPPVSAAFSMMMLGSTPAGDAYTFREYDQMFREAGFGASTIQNLEMSPEQLILTERG